MTARQGGHQPGFDVVALNMVSPSNAPATTLDENHIGFVHLPGHGSTLAARWSFVVTDDGARPYIALGAARAVGRGRAYDYFWYRGRWSKPGWSPCGFESYFVAFYGTAFDMNFVNGCHRTGGEATPSQGAERTRAFPGPGFAVRRPLPAARAR